MEDVNLQDLAKLLQKLENNNDNTQVVTPSEEDNSSEKTSNETELNALVQQLMNKQTTHQLSNETNTLRKLKQEDLLSVDEECDKKSNKKKSKKNKNNAADHVVIPGKQVEFGAKKFIKP